ncbi:MAG: PSD1 and planctomycete cytochrome C domain-containing protein [Planctomycetaceae bacterium]
MIRQTGPAFVSRLGAVVVAVLFGAAATPAADPTVKQLEDRVRAIFKSHCLGCHSGAKAKGELALSNRAGLVKGGESGRVILPGRPEQSSLFEHVEDGSMPPAKDKRLAKADVETIRMWILRGAPYGKGGRLSAAVSQHDTYPILQLRCVVCHGGRARNADLDLRTRESILKGGKSGPAAVAGRPGESLLLKKIHDGSMPPRRRVVEVSIKVIEPAEIEKLAKWIAAGLPISADPPPAADVPLVKAEDRRFWAFQPPRAATSPIVNSTGGNGPIDAFLLRKLEQQGLSLSSAAERSTLLRRATLDVTGLPPRIGEIDAFLDDPDPLAWERQVDRLLASPHFGERWARFWLDLVGYSDSDGIQNADPIRRSAHRYRDYVIRSFNDDKPYDRFLTEQLAGDELADYRNAKIVTQELEDNLVATGFLRFVPDATYANITGFVPDRLEVIKAELEVLASSVLGLSLKCARCHSHKFDPLPQRDYYRLAAIFKGALDENDWLKPYGTSQFSSGAIGFRYMPVVSTARQKAVDKFNAGLAAQAASAQLALKNRAAALRKKHVEIRLAKLPEPLRADLRTMLATKSAERNAIQKYLAEKFEAALSIDEAALKKIEPDYAKAVAATAKQTKELASRKKEQPFVRALWDRGSPSPTYVLRRGNYRTPGRKVEPGVPEVLSPAGFRLEIKPPWPGAKSTGRRLAFARWLVADQHPLTARIIVNRIWKYYFGRGIVATLDDFGKVGSRPSHPQLLDWLAVDLVGKQWRLKSIHRRILLSTAYRQSSTVSREHLLLDPENRLWSRMELKRLDAESLRDGLLAVSGELDTRQFGTADPVTARADGLVTAVRGQRGWRRSIFLLQRRTQIATLLQNFDLPRMNPNCIDRPVSIVAPQALHLLNNKLIRELADRFAERVTREIGDGLEQQVVRVYRIGTGGRPGDEELAAATDVLRKLRSEWVLQIKDDPAAARRRALGNLCHAVMNSAAFIYVD